MADRDIRGRTALVTGASSGIGAAIARELARRGTEVILSARREDRLQALAAELESGGARARVVPADRGAPDGAAALADRLARDGVAVDVLVNNAGFGLRGTFLELPWERERDMIQLDVVALVELTKRLVRPMVERRWGRILLVSSVAAFQPSPKYATYSASKAFVLFFGEAIRHELKGTGVSCTVVAPGPTETEFFEVSGQQRDHLTLWQRKLLMPPGRVARDAVDAMLRGKATVVPGRLNALGATLTSHLLPRSTAAAIAARLVER